MNDTIKLPEVLRVCSLGMDCKAHKLTHFINFWHAPRKLHTTNDKTKKPTPLADSSGKV